MKNTFFEERGQEVDYRLYAAKTFLVKIETYK